MSLLQEMHRHGLAVCDDNRKFLLDDIIAMLPSGREIEWLNSLSEEGLYRLWQDLVNLTTLEDL